MAQASDVFGQPLEPPPEVISEEMAQTRASLTDKLQTLEDHVRTTMAFAQASIEGTVETIQETVHETVETVRHTFDVPHQVRRRPWVFVGASTFVGFVLGRLLAGRSERSEPAQVATRDTHNGAGSPGFTNRPEPPAPPRQPGLFHEEIEKVRAIAISAALSYARDFLKQALPPLAPHLDELMDSATRKLGGEPIRGPLFPPGAMGHE